MAPDRIRDLLNATPFKPFTLEIPSGRQVKVQHTDFARLSPAGRTLVVFSEDDRMEIIDVLLISTATVEGFDPAHN